MIMDNNMGQRKYLNSIKLGKMCLGFKQSGKFESSTNLIKACFRKLEIPRYPTNEGDQLKYLKLNTVY